MGATEVMRNGPVLFAQLWHPEVAPIERTTFIRSIVKDKEHANVLAKLVNADAIEKMGKIWKENAVRDGSNIHHDITNIDSEKKKQKQQEILKKEEKAAEIGEEDKKKMVERLEQERLKKAKAAAEQEEKKRRRAEEITKEEKKNQDPWMEVTIEMKGKDGTKYETTLKQEVDKLESLKAEKRELDRQLEFGAASDLVKEINVQNRQVESATKKAKKAHKKLMKSGGSVPEPKTEAKAEPAADSLEELNKKLAAAKEKKKVALEEEDYKAAGQIKKTIDEIQAKILSLTGKPEL